LETTYPAHDRNVSGATQGLRPKRVIKTIFIWNARGGDVSTRKVQWVYVMLLALVAGAALFLLAADRDDQGGAGDLESPVIVRPDLLNGAAHGNPSRDPAVSGGGGRSVSDDDLFSVDKSAKKLQIRLAGHGRAGLKWEDVRAVVAATDTGDYRMAVTGRQPSVRTASAREVRFDRNGVAELGFSGAVDWVHVTLMGLPEGVHAFGSPRFVETRQRWTTTTFVTYRNLKFLISCLDELGAPVAGATVAIRGRKQTQSGVIVPVSYRIGRSDSSGEVEANLARAVPGPVELAVTHPILASRLVKLEPPSALVRRAHEGVVIEATVVLKSGVTLSVTFKDFSGEPISGALMSICEFEFRGGLTGLASEIDSGAIEGRKTFDMVRTNELGGFVSSGWDPTQSIMVMLRSVPDGRKIIAIHAADFDTVSTGFDNIPYMACFGMPAGGSVQFFVEFEGDCVVRVRGIVRGAVGPGDLKCFVQYGENWAGQFRADLQTWAGESTDTMKFSGFCRLPFAPDAPAMSGEALRICFRNRKESRACLVLTAHLREARIAVCLAI
jgi:hypothetical protein